MENDSRLFVRTNAIKFARHAFPPTSITDMDAMGSLALVHNMSYAVAQAMFYLVVGSRRVQHLHEMEVIHVICVVQ